MGFYRKVFLCNRRLAIPFEATGDLGSCVNAVPIEWAGATRRAAIDLFYSLNTHGRLRSSGDAKQMGPPAGAGSTEIGRGKRTSND